MARVTRYSRASLRAGQDRRLWANWPPPRVPASLTPRYIYLVGASFCNTATNLRPEGPRTGQWLSMIHGYYGDVVSIDGEAGDLLANFMADVDETIARDVANDEMADLMDASILEFFNDAFGESVTGASTAINTAVTLINKMKTRAKKSYFLRFPPLENAGEDSMLYDTVPGLSLAGWNDWRSRYEAALTAAGHTLIDAYYDWAPTLRPINNPPGALDFHITSATAYSAAVRISRAISAEFT